MHSRLKARYDPAPRSLLLAKPFRVKLSNARTTAYRCAARQISPANVRLGSIVCITAPQHFCPLHPS
jgi:hypothetical protein